MWFDVRRRSGETQRNSCGFLDLKQKIHAADDACEQQQQDGSFTSKVLTFVPEPVRSSCLTRTKAPLGQSTTVSAGRFRLLWAVKVKTLQTSMSDSSQSVQSSRVSLTEENTV